MEPETQAFDPSNRLLLIDVRLGSDRGQVRFGPGLTGVLASPPSRSDAAHWIALTLAGPRPDDSDGSVRISGEVVSVRTLPDLLLRPGTPAVIDRTVVRGHWQTLCGGRREELAAMHATHRLESYRLDAALDQARRRARGEIDDPPESLEPEEVDRDDPGSVLRARVRSLLAELDGLPATPHPEARLLADAWGAHASLVRIRDAVDDMPGVDVEPLEERVDLARSDPAVHMLDLPDAVREHIEQCHRVVVEVEPNLLEGRRRDRKRAIAAFEEAIATELVALADVGIESYASFLDLTGGESGPNEAERAVARAELAAARAALDDALQIPDVPTRSELHERGVHLSARATELLGHEPGLDPVAELRAVRAETPERAAKLEEIADALGEAEVEIIGSVEVCARAYIVPAPRALPERAGADGSSVGLSDLAEADLADMERERSEHLREVEELEADLARLEAISTNDVGRLHAPELEYLFEQLLEAYRAGELLRGRLPVVLDGVLDALAAAPRDAAVRVLAAATDVQTIVVSDDPEVLQSVAYAGGTLVRWPEPPPTPHPPTSHPPTSTRLP